MAVSAYLQKTGLAQAPEQRRAALQTELDRIDAAAARLLGHGPGRRPQGRPGAAEDPRLRIKVLGLDRPEIKVTQPRTLVVSGSPEEYVAHLNAIVEKDEQAQARPWPE